MQVPKPTPIFRLIHLDNLNVVLSRGGMHAPNYCPENGLTYKTIHNIDIQKERKTRIITCCPGKVIHDYVSFYFGPRSPMLYQLHTGQVEGYSEGQKQLIYLETTVQAVNSEKSEFVFSDGHGIAKYTSWYNTLEALELLDWESIYSRIWKDDEDHMDRQRKKQAEFLVYKFCPWALIKKIDVIDDHIKTKVVNVFGDYPESCIKPVEVKPTWYY